MNKRSHVVIGVGVALVAGSFGIAFLALPDYDPTLGSDLSMANFLEDMFDYVTHESVLDPGASTIFSYSVRDTDVSLMWVAQIVDFEKGDAVSVHVSSIYDDHLVSVQTSEPAVLDIITVQDMQSYNFEVTNDGNRPITTMMMFVEVSGDSGGLDYGNSPLADMVESMLISGFLLIVGMILIVVGTIIFVMDWKKEKSRPRY